MKIGEIKFRTAKIGLGVEEKSKTELAFHCLFSFLSSVKADLTIVMHVEKLGQTVYCNDVFIPLNLKTRCNSLNLLF